MKLERERLNKWGSRKGENKEKRCMARFLMK